MITPEVEASLQQAFIEGKRSRHACISVEHLLLALIDDPSTANLLMGCACNLEGLRDSLRKFIATNTPIIPEDSEVELQPTFALQRVVQRALLSRFRQPLVIKKGVMPGAITGAAMLIAIFEERDSHAVFYLQQQGATLESVKSKLSARNS